MSSVLVIDGTEASHADAKHSRIVEALAPVKTSYEVHVFVIELESELYVLLRAVQPVGSHCSEDEHEALK